TNQAGNVSQALNYLPFGEEWVDVKQDIDWPSLINYSFNAKEKDYESGFHYYGSRYYSSELSIWNSTDPMADKYPSLTPYSYCANNPVKLIDPNGEEIWIVGDDGNSYQYKKGNLYTKNGDEYIGNDKFANQVKNDLNKLRNLGYKKYIDRLSKKNGRAHRIQRSVSDNYTNAENETNAKNHIKTGSKVFYNPDLHKFEGKLRTNIIGLSHELSHSYDLDKGIEDYSEIGFYIDNKFKRHSIYKREAIAVSRENIIREALNEPLRREYSGLDINDFLPVWQQSKKIKINNILDP
ncbi:MAG: hypothetical protein II878_07655, partial [Bacteroidales bacterium]|nr:hypothetical protein [Bacteroidales bacterium]